MSNVSDKIEKIEKKDIGSALQKFISKDKVETKAVAGIAESVPAAAGYLVNNSIIGEILSVVNTNHRIFNSVRKFQVDGVNASGYVSIPALVTKNTTEPASGTRAYWTDEAATLTRSTPVTAGWNAQLKKITVRCAVTDELYFDQKLLAESIMVEGESKILDLVEREILLGVGKSIKGVAGDGDWGTIGVSTSSDITEAEMKNYVAALHPDAVNAEWYVTPQQYDSIISTNYTADNALVFEGGVYYLFGYRLNKSKFLIGQPYSIVLGDFSKYVLVYQLMQIKESNQFLYDTDQSEIKFNFRIAGMGFGFNESLDDGNEYGWFVVPDGGYAQMSSSSSSESSGSSESGPMMSSSSSKSSESTESAPQMSSSSTSSESDDNPFPQGD